MRSLLIFLFFIYISQNFYSQNIFIKNLSNIDLKDKPIIIERSKLKNIPTKEPYYPIITDEENNLIPSQLDDIDEDGKWDNLFFVIDLKPKSKKILKYKWVYEKPNYILRTNVRFGKRDGKNLPVTMRLEDTLYADKVHAALGYQPYQTDGPMWENDKVGFRHYFDGRNAKDLFGKKVSYITPDTVGINKNKEVVDNYHVMAEWGRDILAVGNSVGLGGYGLIINDTLARVGIVAGTKRNNIEKSIFKILSKGPVHTIMKFTHINWQVAKDRTYNVKEITEIWPGMYAYKNTVTISNLKGDEKLFVGLPKLNTEKPIKQIEPNKEFIVLYTHDKQTYEKQWYLGMALILPRKYFLSTGKSPDEGNVSKTYYAVLKIKNNVPINYFAVGCWELSDENFKNEEYFENYLINLANQLSINLKIKVK